MIHGVSCTEAALWDEVVHDLDGHPLQLWGWGELKSAHDWRAHRVLVIDDDQQVIGAAQILVQTVPFPFRRLCYIPRGPVWLEGYDEAVLEALTHYVKQHLPGVAITVEPDDEAVLFGDPWQRAVSTTLNPDTIILDLSKSERSLEQAMSKKAQQYLKETVPEGFVIKTIKKPEALAPFLKIYRDTAGAEKYMVHESEYYFDTQQFLGDSSIIFGAYEHDKPVAFLWLAVSKKTAFELYGGTSQRGRALHAQYLLKWHAILKCRGWGIDRYDLNGLPDNARGRFKRNFADHTTTLVGTFDYPLSWSYGIWKQLIRTRRAVKRFLRNLLSR